MKLYSYYRSSAAFRVRIALAIKGIEYEYVPVHIGKGQQFEAAFAEVNSQGLVPVLEDNGNRIYQSLAIIQYLDETHPSPRIIPTDPVERNRVRSLALIIACEIHPLNNLRVLKYLTDTLKVTEEQKRAWYQHWVKTGFEALESRLANDPRTGRYCHGDTPGFADISVVPQVANARRFGVDLTAFPTIVRIADACNELEVFRRAAPEAQPDAE